MTREQLQVVMSQKRPEEIETIHVQCRPPEKSDKVLVTTIEGKKWYAERPTYFWSTFDQSFITKGYFEEQEWLYPDIEEPLLFFDKQGLLWAREEMSSFGLVEHFLKHPTKYLAIMARHTHDVANIVATLERIKPTLDKPEHFPENLRLFVDLYTLMYRAEYSIYGAFDELVWQFRNFLLERLPKETVNVYFPEFLSGEATKEALKERYYEDREALEYSTTRGLLWAMHLKPQAFYARPQFFPSYTLDHDIIDALLEKGINQQDLETFLAYRLIVPAGFQINEESQYIETSALSAHLGILIQAIAETLNKPIEAFQALTVADIIEELKSQEV